MSKNIIFVILVTLLGYTQMAIAVESGLSKYWTDNYKAFHQIYGKTSDLELYGQALPLSVTYGGTEIQKLKKSDASRSPSESNSYETIDSATAGTDENPFQYSSSYPQLFATRKRTKNNVKKLRNAPKYGAVFTEEDSIESFKPVNKEIDPATLEYIKQFEHLDTQQAIDFPQEGLTGFKPYAGLTYKNLKNLPQLSDSYKSIQDIIDANDSDEDEVFERQKANHELAHKAYGYIPKIKFEGVDNLPAVRQKPGKPSFKFFQGYEIPKKPTRGRCSSGRCRKAPPPARVRNVRPRITKIKHRIVSSTL